MCGRVGFVSGTVQLFDLLLKLMHYNSVDIVEASTVVLYCHVEHEID